MANLVLALAFFGGFLLVFGVNFVLNDVFESHRKQARKRLEEELRKRHSERARDSLAYKDLYEMAAEGVADVRENHTLVGRFLKMVEQSGVSMGPGRIVTLALVIGSAMAGLLYVATWQWVYALPAGLVGCAMPILWVAYMRSKRLEKLIAQIPDAFDLMARTMRAGQTISQALQAVADECSPPLGEEFQYCCEQQNLGLSPEAALRDLARRTGVLELKIFVLAVVVHRQSGGNLTELLDKLAKVVRERFRIRGKIKSLTAEGRSQAMVLLALPPFMMILLLFVARPYMIELFKYPTLLVGMFVSMALGGLWMRKIINFDF
ncbi:MAG: type II secretion system F family protein [Planctomycetota bacterium]|jgi:tight adherence protein B